jgi:hypothetical protein
MRGLDPMTIKCHSPPFSLDHTEFSGSHLRPRRPGSLRLSTKTVSTDACKNEPVATNGRCSSMIERLEHALALVAYIVLRHGPVYAPFIDRLERELEAARQNDPTVRAKRILETYANEGNPNVVWHDRLRSRSKD